METVRLLHGDGGPGDDESLSNLEALGEKRPNSQRWTNLYVWGARKGVGVKYDYSYMDCVTVCDEQPANPLILHLKREERGMRRSRTHLLKTQCHDH